MLERQDIDALLVGALYGELSSTEQAQLTAHLESHPADRSALDDLKSVRERFTSSRIFEVQLEPPQSVSALLLQEAARRAPKQVIATDKKESWFDRFVRSFIAHPAMAAAATLVLVLGVAGTIYLNGGETSQPRVAQSEETISKNLSAVPSEGAWGSSAMNAPMQALDPSATPRAAPAVAAGDSKHDSVQVALDEDKIAKTGSVSSDLPRNREQIGFADGKAKQEAAHHGTASAVEVAKTAPAKAAKGRYVEVPKEEPQPKDFESELQDSSGKDVVAKNDRAEASRGAGPGGGGAANGNFAGPAGTVAQQSRPSASPPPPPPSPVAATSAAEPPTAKPATKPDASLAWAKDQHARIIALVKDGKCSAAVPLAATLKTRAPDYYATNVATDRALKSCMQYVNDSTTERAAEKKAAAAKATDSR